MAATQKTTKKKPARSTDRRNIWLLIITTLLVLGSVFMFMPPQEKINQGLDIQGGLSVVLTAKSTDGADVTNDDMEKSRAIIESRVNALGASEAVVQTTTADGDQGFLVRTTTTSAEEATQRANQVADKLGLSTDSFEVTTIGPDWGASVIQSSLNAILVSIVLIIIYIAIRFEYKMGVTAIVALLHDLVLVMGVYALVGREVNPNTIAALLTILGYSLYDTVVVFHRINDNMQSDDIKCTFMTMANHSINQVLVRTVNTTLTSLIPVLAMLLFGGETLKDFAFAMVIGLVCGSYSSIAVASPLYAMWKTREPRYQKLVKKFGPEVGRFEFGNPNAMAAALSGKKAVKATAAAASAAPAPEKPQAEEPHGATAAKAAPKPPKAKRKKRPDKK